MIYFRSFFGHLRNIIVHKYWVFYYACKFGIPWRGFMHDWSKFHPTEFWESVKWYQGTSSPIPVCKKANGISFAWQHHKGHNPHHYEYWIDNFENSTPTYHKIPYKYVMEMLADWFAAGRTYNGKDFKPIDEYNWWRSRRKNHIAMSVPLIRFIDSFMDSCMVNNEIDWVKKSNLKERLNIFYTVYE